jgi:hypothetical protein
VKITETVCIGMFAAAPEFSYQIIYQGLVSFEKIPNLTLPIPVIAGRGFLYNFFS